MMKLCGISTVRDFTVLFFGLSAGTLRGLVKMFILLEIRSMERGICPIAVLYFAEIRSFFDI